MNLGILDFVASRGPLLFGLFFLSICLSSVILFCFVVYAGVYLWFTIGPILTLVIPPSILLGFFVWYGANSNK